jgi:hypothetical protein
MPSFFAACSTVSVSASDTGCLSQRLEQTRVSDTEFTARLTCAELPASDGDAVDTELIGDLLLRDASCVSDCASDRWRWKLLRRLDLLDQSTHWCTSDSLRPEWHDAGTGSRLC